MEKTEAIILVGSNHSERVAIVESVMARLSEMLEGFVGSAGIELPDASGKGSPYVNAVCRGEVACGLDELTRQTKALEAEWGRTAESKQRGVVEVDIDVVVWGGKVLRERDASQDYFKIPLSRLDAGR